MGTKSHICDELYTIFLIYDFRYQTNRNNIIENIEPNFYFDVTSNNAIVRHFSIKPHVESITQVKGNVCKYWILPIKKSHFGTNNITVTNVNTNINIAKSKIKKTQNSSLQKINYEARAITFCKMLLQKKIVGIRSIEFSIINLMSRTHHSFNYQHGYTMSK